MTDSPVPGSRPKWVDLHCHLDLYPNHEALIAECDREEVATLTVTTTPKAWSRNRDLAAKSRHVRVALGIHPHLVAERAGELALFEKYLPEARYVGEVGLDAGPRFYKSLELQERVFEHVLRACADQGGKILTVHSVRSTARILGHIERALPEAKGRVVLHWFTGTGAEAKRAVALGCFFSINMAMLRSPKHREVIRELPPDRILTETDGPFLDTENRPVRPRDVAATVAELAEVRGTDAGEMSRTILGNLAALVRG